MARASTPTLLSLDRYAAVLGWPPPSFNQGVSNVIFPSGTDCGPVFQYAWQYHDAVSREDIAKEIAVAEQDIANYMGWWPAPTWIAQDVEMYGRFHRPEYITAGMRNERSFSKSVKTRYGKIIEPGQRAVTLLGTATVGGSPCSMTFSDDDGDGFSETVTVSCSSITVTDECEIKIYFAGHDGEPEWEIRPARTKTLAAGVFTATFYAWQFIDPDRWEAFPTSTTPKPTIDLDTAVYVTSVEIYREYNDTTATSATLIWEPEPDVFVNGYCSTCGGTGCAVCVRTEQDGCAHIRDAEMGTLVPVPGTYSADDAAWLSATQSVCRDPDSVRLYYYCGKLSDENLAGRRCTGLSDEWARIITWLATARLRRPFCDCGSAGSLVEYLQTDLSKATREVTYTVLWDELSNPFGVRIGEMEAYRHCRSLEPNRQAGAGAV